MNSVSLIGNLTRDPEIRTFGNGGKVANFSIAVNEKKKNATTGQWEDDPMFIEVAVFNRGDTGALANVVEQYCRKGNKIGISGKLKLERWDDKTTGQGRQKHTIIAHAIDLLGSKNDNAGAPSREQEAPASQQQASEPPAESGPGEEIPFVFWLPWVIGTLSMFA